MIQKKSYIGWKLANDKKWKKRRKLYKTVRSELKTVLNAKIYSFSDLAKIILISAAIRILIDELF